MILRPEIKGAHDRRSGRGNIEQQEYHVQQLIHHTYRRHRVIGMMAQHKRIHHA